MTEPSVPTPIVYIVDDDADVLRATAASVSHQEWDVLTFNRATEFLNAYQSNRPGCLVLDVQMPEMSGLELQKQLSDWGMDIPIIFVTGAGSVANSVSALKGGAVDFIEKPFSRESLLETIRKAIYGQAESRRERHALDNANSLFADLTEREGIGAKNFV